MNRFNIEKVNYNFWQNEYDAKNVESWIFRLKPYILDPHFNKIKKNKINVLDFGCGEGATVNFFNSFKSYCAYGVDISKVSIKNAKKNSKNPNNFKLIKENVTKDDFFKKKFDVIIANQVLYFLTDQQLSERLNYFNQVLNDNGLVFFSMKSTKDIYYKRFAKKGKKFCNMTKVCLHSDKEYKERTKRSRFTHYVSFIESKKQLIKKFNMFEKKYIGFYDQNFFSTEATGHHYTFIGIKR